MPKLRNEAGIIYLRDLRSRKYAFDPSDIVSDLSLSHAKEWDLFFFCSDGAVPAHRLVIANASKYIMHMLDDQPPWHPTFVHVMDLPKSIVQLLVDLAYTGEMKFAEELQSDVFDAMQTLGWVHTDCLSANYDGEELALSDLPLPKSPPKFEPKQNQGTNDVENHHALPSPTITKKTSDTASGSKSPARSSMRAERISFNEEDESMEISHLPDVDWSDGEDFNLESSVGTKRRSKTPNSSTDQKKENHSLAKNVKKVGNSMDEKKKPNQQKRGKGKSAVPPNSGRKSTRGVSISKSNQTTEVADNDDDDNNSNPEIIVETSALSKKKTSTTKQGKAKGPGRPSKAVASIKKAPIEIEVAVLDDDDNSQTSVVSDAFSINDSPGKRQRRKPKKFEDFEELIDKPKQRSPQKRLVTPIKRKQLPSNVTPEEKVKNSLEKVSTDQEEIDLTSQEVVVVTESASASSSKSKATKTPAKAVARRKFSGEIPPKNTLITSFFTKSGSKGDKTEESNNDDKNNSVTELNSSRRGRGKQRKDSSAKVDDADDDIETLDPDNDDDAGTNASNVSESDSLKLENKKRSFDEIRASNLELEKTEGNGDILDKSDLTINDKPRPGRKSSRVSSKALSTESNKSKAEDDCELQKRKRAKKDNTESTVQIQMESNDNEVTESETPSRRSSTRSDKDKP